MAPIWRSLFSPPKIVFYALFYGLHVALFAVGWYLQASNPRLAMLNTLNFSVWISRGAGMALSFDAAVILFPMCRTLMRTLRPRLRFLPLDETEWFHRQCAYCLLFFTIVHTAAHYVNFYNIELLQVRPETAVQMLYTEAAGITGHVMLLCMFLIYTTAHARIRQQSYETFWYSHHLFVPFLLALYTHATGCFVRSSPQPYSPFAGRQFWHNCLGYEGWRWELWGGALYLLERIVREIRAARYTEITRVIRHPYDAVEIQFYKPTLRYKPGQWIFIQVPDVSRHQWHPYTITSCPFDPYISIHVRQVGDFTRDLANRLGCGPEQASDLDGLDPMGMYEIALHNAEAMPALRIDGPYGAPAEDVFSNDVAVLIGMGIGATPWASILKNIWHLRRRTEAHSATRRLRRVEFVWICKETNSFEWFQALLSSLECQERSEAGLAPVTPGPRAFESRLQDLLPSPGPRSPGAMVPPPTPGLKPPPTPFRQSHLPPYHPPSRPYSYPYPFPNQTTTTTAMHILPKSPSPFPSIIAATAAAPPPLTPSAESTPTSFLGIHTYLTRGFDPDTAANIYLNSVGSRRDPLTELRTGTKYGRPDFERFFVGIRERIMGSMLGQCAHGDENGQDNGNGGGGGSRAQVGVYFCGPNHAAPAIKKATSRCATKQVRFKFWKEHF